MVVKNGKQAALMAPTGILAEQHYRGISKTFANYPDEQKPNIALLTGSLTDKERETIYAGLADGTIDIVIGTHAIIQAGVEFNDLGLAIIDEQHRFGVGQRGTLRSKGHHPHLLIMTATPIPRTMALTIYADLDLTVIDEMPPGRTPIDTRVVLPSERERIYSFIKKQLNEGRQAFIVHPLVTASEKIDAASAVEAYDVLSKVFFRYRVCLLHGQMKPTEKDQIMEAFANHEYDVMVTTSVAEVGVDIPNASVIVIEGANRFGLAQLHQFRGRVGRGQYESYCMLIPDDVTYETASQLEKIQSWDAITDASLPESVRRLRAMEMTTDGFKLAEVDWQLRGAGDLVGTRQSGRNRLQVAEMMSPELVALAQREALTIYEEDKHLDHPEHRLLKERVAMLYNEDSDFS
jgi:ATP-dependent DNA helicase RecG